ncbi:MAG: hypothetical protein IKM22_00085 [Clostridia bacterium]|nr:hypothetical protein [Clostridia bacterium]
MKRFFIIVLAFLTLLSFASCNREQTEVTDGMKLAGKDAGNEAVGYSFTYPEEWEIVRNDGVVEIQFDCNPSDAVAEYATLTVLAFTLPQSDMTAKDYWESHKTEVEKAFADFKQLDTVEYNEPDKYLDDAPALKVKYSSKMNDRTYVSDQIICCRYGEVFLITLVAPEEYYESVSNVIGSVKDNFNFA